MTDGRPAVETRVVGRSLKTVVSDIEANNARTTSPWHRSASTRRVDESIRCRPHSGFGGMEERSVHMCEGGDFGGQDRIHEGWRHRGGSRKYTRGPTLVHRRVDGPSLWILDYSFAVPAVFKVDPR